MSEILTLAISAGIFFFILELFTGTFYGLSLSIASFAVALYIYLSGSTDTYIIQAGIFLVTAALCTFFAPKIFARFFPDTEEIIMKNNYLDDHIGKTFPIKGKSGSFKISIDGVDYLIHEDSITNEFSEGRKVTLSGISGSRVHVTLM